MEHPEEGRPVIERADMDLVLRLLERFVNVPFRGGKRALPGRRHSRRQSLT